MWLYNEEICFADFLFWMMIWFTMDKQSPRALKTLRVPQELNKINNRVKPTSVFKWERKTKYICHQEKFSSYYVGSYLE